MFGMPLDAWVLLFCAVAFGLTLELAFYVGRRRKGASADAGGDPGGAP